MFTCRPAKIREVVDVVGQVDLEGVEHVAHLGQAFGSRYQIEPGVLRAAVNRPSKPGVRLPRTICSLTLQVARGYRDLDETKPPVVPGPCRRLES